jgi:hypothetical protein
MKRAPGYSCRERGGRDSKRGYECVLTRAVIALRGTVKSKTYGGVEVVISAGISYQSTGVAHLEFAQQAAKAGNGIVHAETARGRLTRTVRTRRVHRNTGDSVAGVRGLEPPDVISTIFVVAARGQNVSSPTISANQREFSQLFQPFRENDICEFESSHPSHGVNVSGSRRLPVRAASSAAPEHKSETQRAL